ncbi:hypothetical protein Sfulv_00420 [Streptomyces fulvorobeus]|uniref:Uncharacterized protein n=1 Tax=Streptomyces fulvorobeus TaxID=284028 RepID=A0A7J0BYC7_9ACTN|nr:hypothetical protein [Streptomyces fulvorobeus]GFM95231.1 hypothetical protein Sfulv_00420 [Streptomyces fulvorobeus]
MTGRLTTALTLSVSGPGGDAEPGRELRERVMAAQVHQADQSTLVRRQPAAAGGGGHPRG